MEAPTQSPMPGNLGQQCGKMGLEAGLGGDTYMHVYMQYIYIYYIYIYIYIFITHIYIYVSLAKCPLATCWQLQQINWYLSYASSFNRLVHCFVVQWANWHGHWHLWAYEVTWIACGVATFQLNLTFLAWWTSQKLTACPENRLSRKESKSSSNHPFFCCYCWWTKSCTT